MADTKVTGLTAIASPALTDLLYVVADPGGTPASKKATLANVAAVLGLGVTLTDWTPSLTQSGAVSKTVTYAKYCTIGPLMFICAQLDITGAGTGNNNILIGNLPAQPAAVGVYGTAWVNNNGTAFYQGAAYYTTGAGGVFYFFAHLETSGMGIDPNFALANTDEISFYALYPPAS
jgi:hypothetical protein